jgi:pimeloyl-ACP methyl ester carboxylesterase
VKAFSETDFHEDLKKFDIPTLLMHGEDDQIVPINLSSRKPAKLIKNVAEIYYPGLPHGLTATHPDVSIATCSRSTRKANGKSRDPHLIFFVAS